MREDVRVCDAFGRGVRRVCVRVRGDFWRGALARRQKLVASGAVGRERALAALLPVAVEAGGVARRRLLQHPLLQPERLDLQVVQGKLARRLRDVLLLRVALRLAWLVTYCAAIQARLRLRLI